VGGPSFEHIDPMAFDDPQTGKKLLYWGSGFRPIKVRELAKDRL
jgi:arabinan endo-1,5-alpha-L-arabinosidase